VTDRFDIIIIGAGAAGLAAARDLSGAGRSVAILEARQRIGGRIWTVHTPDLPLPIELGAEFIHGEAHETFAIVDAAALLAYELSNDHFWSAGRQWRQVNHYWRRIVRILARIPSHGRDISFDDFLKRQKNLSPLDRRLVLRFVEGYQAAHADRISAASLRLTSEDRKQPKQHRIANGYDALIESLRAGLEPSRTLFRLDTEVTEIEWKRGHVEVRTRHGDSVRARAAVITIPLGVWKSPAAIRFNPPLHDKQRAITKLEAGHVVKVVFRFRERFWDDSFLFVHSADRFMPTWWTTAPVRSTLLTGWTGGQTADALLATGKVAESALDSLASTFGRKRREIDSLLDSMHTHDWQADPFSRGAYSYAGVGGVGAHDALAKPVAGTLFFAGEATSSDETGTVAGAITTGRRAAKEILAVLA
jgi:monoamine oxidase